MSPPAGGIRSTAPRSLVLLALAAALSTTPAHAAVQACDFVFAPPSLLATPAKPNRVALADLNHDGILDLVVSTPDGFSGGSAATISVVLGRGGGAFASPVNYAVGSRPMEAVVGDFDGDGVPDLAVTNWGSNNVAILHGNGDGTFSAPSFFPGGSNPHGLVAADFNHDGILDLAVANNGVASVSVLMGLGSGGVGSGAFAAPVAYPVADVSMGISVADLDGDGNLDLVATANFAGIGVLIGHGDGTFGPAHAYAAGTQPSQITIQDLDADGKPDLLVSNTDFGGVAFLKGLGGGAFGSPTIYGADTVNANSTVIADFNGDGILDFAVSNSRDGVQDGLVQIFLGQSSGGVPTGTFSLMSSTAAPSNCRGMAASDLNGDGRPDVIIAGYGTSVVDILFGDCYVPPPPPVPACNLPLLLAPPIVQAMPAKPNRLTLVELNGDGNRDLVATTPDSSNGAPATTISVMLGIGGGAFAAPVNYAVGSRPMEAVAGDFDRDGKIDLAVADQGSNNVAILRGNGDGTFGTPTFFPCGSDVQPSALVAGDFNLDGNLDLAVANAFSPHLAVLMGRGDGTFAAPVFYALGGSYNPSESISAADLDQNGTLDLVVTGGLAAMYGRGDGTFVQHSIYAGPSPVQVTIRDLDGDGHPDLLVANGNFGGVAVVKGLGGGVFAPPTLYGGALNAQSTVVADFNGDGILDFAVSNPRDGVRDGLVQIFLGQSTAGLPNGTFSFHSNYTVPPNCNGIVTSDFNGDRRPDVIVAGYGTSVIDILLGDCLDQPVPTVASLASVEAAADRIRLTWYTAGNAGLAATVYRRTAATDWVAMGRISADGTGYLRYEDTSVQPGARYGYRLGIMDAGAPVFVAEVWVTAEAPALMLEGARPNPASGNALKVDFTLPSAEPARLELFDVGGRRVAAREVGSLGAGWHTVDLAAGKRIPAGIYVIRFSQRGAVRTAHVTVLN